MQGARILRDFFVAFICLSIIGDAAAKSAKTKNKLLLMLFDGFRWNYFDNFSSLPNFNRFRQEGVHAEYMRPNFPSLSYPGYYAVLTGRYAESNGFVSNTMYDKYHDMFFYTDTDDNGSMSFWWNYTDPLWTTTVKAGLKTVVYHWPGCHVSINDVVPTVYKQYEKVNSTDQLEEDIVDVVHKLATDEGDVGIIYAEYTDMIGHKFGPESPEIKMAVKDIDNAIGILLDELNKTNLMERVNIILVSDHGMTDVSNSTKIRLDKIFNLDDVAYLLDYGSMTGIQPVDGKMDKVYADLKNVPDVYVWKADEIPENLHLKHNYRVPPLLLVAKPNVFIEPLVNNSKHYPPVNKTRTYLGFHGYLPSDSKDMGAIFLAHGPDFKANYLAPPIYMVDVYNLMTHLINVEGLPNNGTWGNVRGMLKVESEPYTSASAAGSSPTVVPLMWCNLLSTVVAIFFVFCNYRTA